MVDPRFTSLPQGSAAQAPAATAPKNALPPGFALPEGLILAGGESRRMGGGNKALLALAGKPLVAHVVARLDQQTATLRINANQQRETYQAYGPVVPDAPDLPASAGPLTGVASGLRVCRTDWLLCAPCDTPWLPLDLVSRLAAAAQQANALAATARTAERRHPVCLLVHCSLEPELSRWLQAGGRKVEHWLAELPAADALFPHEAEFANLNRPQDLVWAEQHISDQCNQRPKG